MAKDPTNLGELEMALMDHLWEHESCDVKQAHAAVGRSRKITLNTVQSAMKRLWEKGLMDRQKSGHAYVYCAAVDRRGLTEMMIVELLDQVAGAEIDVALQAFVNLADQAGEENLKRLEELVAARRKADER